MVPKKGEEKKEIAHQQGLRAGREAWVRKVPAGLPVCWQTIWLQQNAELESYQILKSSAFKLKGKPNPIKASDCWIMGEIYTYWQPTERQKSIFDLGLRKWVYA